MFDASLTALGLLLEPARLAVLVMGVIAGLAVGVIPGLGGIVGLTLLIPFTLSMDPYTAFALLLGMAAVTTTSDTIPAVLFGVPGTTGSAATVLDGHAMARRGEAGRALGAAFSASLVGGVIGAVLLALAIPLIQPLVLAVGSPELLAISILGLSMAAALSGKAPLRGLIMVCLGLLLSMVGSDPVSGVSRWTFSSLYLLDGLELVPVTLGLFAVPEIAAMAVGRRGIASRNNTPGQSSRWHGVGDLVRHKWLVARSSVIGAGIGALPGLGSSVVDWIAYGYAARTVKGAQETFGTGDVRGVLAPEGANNAKEGGALVPTIAFGVPGSASMAILLGAFMVHGLQPGPRMLTDNLDVTYTMVWSLSLANIIGAGACLLLSDQFARIATLRFTLIVPLVLSVVLVGAYQGSRQWGDLVSLVLFGGLGWAMKCLGWPRAPLILGFVLGALVERYLFISIARYGWDWLFRPAVLVLIAIAVVTLCVPLWRRLGQARLGLARRGALRAKRPGASDLAGMAFVMLAAAMFWTSREWSSDNARLAPTIILFIGTGLALLSLASSVFPGAAPERRGKYPWPAYHAHGGGEGRSLLLGEGAARRSAVFFGWILSTLAVIWLAGFLPAIFALIALYLRLEGGEAWRRSLAIAGGAAMPLYLVFDLLLATVWPRSLLGDFLRVVMDTFVSARWPG